MIDDGVGVGIAEYDAGFFEFQTPILTASSPEGARDYLVPSRVHPGKFYALPQAPQQFKQLIMMAGFDRYFQIAPCFRDEDARADRSPGEFYQLDLEMSFVTQEDIFDTIEPIIRGLFQDFGNGQPVTPKFPRIAYKEAMHKYGTDKPDLRNPIEMEDVSEHFRGSGFKVFAGMLEKDANARVWAIPGEGGGSRAVCDRMNSWAQGEGQPGLGYIFFRDGEGAGPVAKNIGPERTAAIRTQLELADGDAVFFVAGLPKEFVEFAARARTKIGEELKLTSSGRFDFCWIVDFPMFEWNEDEKKIDFSHNPFSMPQGGLEALDTMEPEEVLAYQYDLVCNGVELSSGAIRNHKPEIMEKAFAIAGYPTEELEARFGGMLDRTPGTVDVFLVSPRQAGNFRIFQLGRDLRDSLEITIGGSGKPGFDDIDAQFLELHGQTQFFSRIHAGPGTLLPIPQCGVKKFYSIVSTHYF